VRFVIFALFILVLFAGLLAWSSEEAAGWPLSVQFVALLALGLGGCLMGLALRRSDASKE